MTLNKVLWAVSAAVILLGAASCATTNIDGGRATSSAARSLPPRPMLNDPFEALENPAVSFTRRPYRSL